MQTVTIGKPPQPAQQLFESPGYFRGIAFSDGELDTVRRMIRAKWLSRLVSARPDKKALFEQLPIERYHEVSGLINHATAWGKGSRLFSPEEVVQLRGMSLFDRIEDALGPFDVADIEGLGYPEIYWRLIRPDAADDVAGAHTDEWFYTYTNNLNPRQQAGLVKVWIAVHVDPGLSGLSVVPDSHLRDWPNHAEMRHGRPKPVLDVDQNTLNLVNVDTRPGEAVLFHIRLLHAGIAHTGTRCRISMECAIRLRK